MNRVFLAAMLASAGFAAMCAESTVAQTAPQGDDNAVTTRADALAAADRRFDKIDANKDGKLTADEMRPPRAPMNGDGPPPPPPADGAGPPPPPPGAGGTGGPGGGMFARLDTNGDGAIDRDEFRAQAARRFDRMDANKDGTIDAAERQAARDARGMRGPRGGPGGDMPPPPPPGAPSDKPGQ